MAQDTIYTTVTKLLPQIIEIIDNDPKMKYHEIANILNIRGYCNSRKKPFDSSDISFAITCHAPNYRRKCPINRGPNKKSRAKSSTDEIVEGGSFMKFDPNGLVKVKDFPKETLSLDKLVTDNYKSWHVNPSFTPEEIKAKAKELKDKLNPSKPKKSPVKKTLSENDIGMFFYDTDGVIVELIAYEVKPVLTFKRLGSDETIDMSLDDAKLDYKLVKNAQEAIADLYNQLEESND